MIERWQGFKFAYNVPSIADGGIKSTNDY